MPDRTDGNGRSGRAAASRNFNGNNFRRDMSSNRVGGGNRNVAINNNRNVNVNRNVVINGGGGRGCCGGYNSGPGWGGVAVGVATGVAVGAIAHSAATSNYAPPPPYVPPGYVLVPEY